MKRYRLLILSMAILAATAALAPAQIVTESVFVKPAAPGTGSTELYLRIVNQGSAPVRLMGASSPVASAGELRQTFTWEGMVKTARFPDGVEIPAGGEMVLEPGGYHIMFVGLNRPIVEGETLLVRLVFAERDPVDLEAQTETDRAKNPARPTPPPPENERVAALIVTESVFVEPTPPGIDSTALYLRIVNHGSAPVRLMGASSPMASAGELRHFFEWEGMVKMALLPDGVKIPAGGEIVLEPEGYHIKLVGLKRPIVEGDTLQVRLEFAERDPLDVEAQAKTVQARKPALPPPSSETDPRAPPQN